jgi:hypothetical protein
MAEFKLGRIRFVWKGQWASTTDYIVDDVVAFNGKTYICVVTHTADVFNTDLTAGIPKWNLMADGVTWDGVWTPTTDYSPGTIVRYGGTTYICVNDHTSGSTFDDADWDVFATSFDWKTDWTDGEDYKVNDVVKYGGKTYVCNTAHTSGTYLTDDSSNWDILNAGLEYKGAWSSSSVYYKANDVVKYGADLWICTTGHTSSATFSTANFQVFVNGFQFESSWSSSTTYQVGDVVTYGGYTYVALQNHSNQTPSTATSYWSVFTTGFNYQGDYVGATAYKIGDVVRQGGYTYLALQDTTGNTPPDGTYWAQLNSGLKWKNTSVSYTAVASSNLVATGSGSPTFDVTRNNAVYTVTIHSGAAGTGYTVGDTLKVLGTAVGGQSPINDVTLTVATITGGGGTGPIGTVTATGIAVTWTTSTAYVLGDVVLYGANSYICVNAHTSSSGNRPDADTTGTYWNLLTAGAESAQLTTTGDTFYYSESGPARLPIGLDGQILRVSNGLPSWGYFGQVNNLIYVAPQGTDRPDYGSSPENPLKTIRYACELVENGYLNQNATALIAKNKQFLMKEVNNYTYFAFSASVGKTYASTDGTRPNQLELATLATTSATASNGTATIGFSTQTVPPYAIGESIVVNSVTPSAFNGTHTVTACTTSSVSFALVGTYGPQTVAGTISRTTNNLTLNMPITFSANANGITAGTTYYVQAIADTTHFTVSATPSGIAVTISTTGSVTTVGRYAYDQTKSERDAGLAIDGILHDLGHGGTLKTTTNALAYFNSAGTSYVSGVSSYEITQFTSSLSYLVTIISNVLNNTAPTNSYQTLNNQSTTASQITDGTLTAETTAAATVSSLVSIITSALTAGTTSGVATAIQPNTTISVKTGTYTEVLPIVVPRNTAIVGDELRSTTVQPKPAIASLANDKAKTVSALNRIKSIVPDLISNTTITPTSGNTQAQVKTLPTGSVGSTAAATAVGTSSDIIYQIVDGGSGSVPTFVFNEPTGYNTSFLAGYKDGKNQLIANYAYIKAEISAYIAYGYSSLWSSLGATGQANCQRDIGYILDALQHDMTYGGNVQTLIAGSSYYSNYVSTIAAGERTAILDAYGRLKTVVGEIIKETNVTETSGNVAVQDTSGTPGSDAARDFAKARIQDIIDWITNGTAPTAVAPTAAIALASSGLQTAYTTLQAKKAEIQADTVAWVKKYYQSMNFNAATCSRDAGYIVDALSYDLVLGTNFNAITAGRSYLRAISSVTTVMTEQKVAELGAINFIKYKAKQVASSGASAEIVNAITDITNYIQGGAVPTTVWPSFTGVDAENYAAAQLIWANKEFLKAETTAYIDQQIGLGTSGFVGLEYDVLTCERDVGYIVDAIRYDMTYGGNFATRQAGLAYYSQLTSALQIDAADKTATLSAYSHLKTMLQDIANGGLSSYTPLQVAVSYTTFNSGGDSASATMVGGLVDGITATITALGSAPAETLASTSWVASNLTGANTALQSARTSIRSNVISYINTNFPTLTYDDVTCSRDIGYVIDAIGYDVMFGSNFRSIKAGMSYYQAQAALAIGAQKVATIAAFQFLKTEIASTITDATALYRANQLMDIVINIINKGVGTTPEVHGTVTYTNTLGTIKGVEILRANKNFLAYEATAWIADQFPTYTFDAASCRRDMLAYVDALIYDLQYTGNYKSLRAAKVYVNAVVGSQAENMFLVRNGSGLRNMTMSGLTGTLGASNEYGTKRPTAGAYSSLDEGFGPNDTEVWINTRSCYAQNCTMFGDGCVGMKIDGALHAGGNRSIVANDYTTIISDGIGVWATGSNALTELISVFNYYGYAGYLSELGARIRAANGNSSYGTYGVIAEGVDTYEVPITATINNRYYQAQITNVNTDGLNQVLRFEYGNAGSAYTNTVHSISGAGYNATATADEFRDASIFETRLIDNNDGSTTSVGGTNYVSQSNAAQTGAVGEITIANTDTALSTAYAGMRIQITAGTGVGQYANILNYNNGNKIAKIVKDSFTTLTVTATTNGSPSTVTVASTATLYANMPFMVATTVGGLTANTVYYVKTIASATTFTVSATSGGTAFTSEITTTTSQTVSLYAAGWDHIVPGNTVVNVLDLTTTYIIEPRIQYTAPGYTGTARTLSATATWTSAAYGAGKFVAVASGGTSAGQSGDGKTWTSAGALPTSTTWGDVVYAGGQGATATAVIGGLGGSGAILTAVLGYANSQGLPQADQVASVTIVNGGVGYTTPPTIEFTSGSGANATATCTVRNGAIASVTVTVNGSGYLTAPTVTAATDKITSIVVNTRGKDYTNQAAVTVTITGGGASVQGTSVLGSSNFTNGGISSIPVTTAGSGYTSVPNVAILDTGAKFVAIATTANNTATQTIAGLVGPSAWSAGTSTGKTDLAEIAFGTPGGAGVLVAVGGTSGTESVVSSADFGATWTDRTTAATTANDISTGKYTSVTFGNGIFLAVNGGGGNKSITSTNGTTTWSAGGTIPFTTAVSVTYGNGRFVVLGSDGAVAYSTDLGVTWTAAPTCGAATTSILSSSYTWTRIKYGQGLFVAISQGTVGATSPDGINWTVRTLPTNTNWKGLAFGNPSNNPIWVAVSNSSSTNGASIVTGATAQGRVKVTSGAVSEVRMTEPGSAYPKGSVTATTGSSTDSITVNVTTNLVDSQPVEFTGLDAYGLTTNTTYYVIGSTIVADTSFKVSATAGSSTPVDLTTGTGLTGTYRAGPIVTVTDPNKVKTALMRVRQGDGALGNPSFSNRGSAMTTATAQTAGDGYADLYQNTGYINVSGLYEAPTAGANIQFDSISGTWYKLVSVTNKLGVAGNYTATFQINPALTTKNAPAHGDAITTRLKYSQVRLTGHDFLYIGTGGKAATNYPDVDPTMAIQANQTAGFGGGRVFFTSTDQDGNFNVGNLFGVQQATGTATLNASAFNLAGLQSLQLGAVSLGVGSAIINQFSTDPYFTANSDSILPTQKAVKAYITSQIGGGASTLNVNTLTSGVIYIAGNTISTTSGVQINITSKMNFTGGIDGAPVALAYFTQK